MVNPTRRQLIMLAHEMGMADIAHDAVEFAYAVLARWGAAPPRPIPVSERPEAGDCDAKGRCWWWYAPVPEQTYGYWAHEDYAIPERALDEWPTHWLPTHALPLPSGEGE